MVKLYLGVSVSYPDETHRGLLWVKQNKTTMTTKKQTAFEGDLRFKWKQTQ